MEAEFRDAADLPWEEDLLVVVDVQALQEYLSVSVEEGLVEHHNVAAAAAAAEAVAVHLEPVLVPLEEGSSQDRRSLRAMDCLE